MRLFSMYDLWSFCVGNPSIPICSRASFARFICLGVYPCILLSTVGNFKWIWLSETGVIGLDFIVTSYNVILVSLTLCTYNPCPASTNLITEPSPRKTRNSFCAADNQKRPVVPSLTTPKIKYSQLNVKRTTRFLPNSRTFRRFYTSCFLHLNVMLALLYLLVDDVKMWHDDAESNTIHFTPRSLSDSAQLSP